MTTRASAPEDGDRALVAAYLRGRGEAAFRALYRRHTPRLYGLALRLLDGEERDAEETVQETWIRAAQRLDGFAWRSSLATWLAGIAIHVCRDRLRRRRSRLRPVPLEPAAAEPAVAAAGDGGRVDLQRAISALSERCRQVLVLHDVEGYTHREISGFLGIEVGTSKSHLFQARRTMRARLGRESEREP